MITQPADRLRKLGTEIFMAAGSPKLKAEFVADTLVEASLTGHDSHGVVYFVRYTDRIKQGFIDVNAEPVTVKETESSALIDGMWAFGQVTALHAMKMAVEKAKKNVIGAVGAYNCSHIGRVGYYTSWAARQGLAAMMFVNVGHPTVTIFGGHGRVVGTNPFSASLPIGKNEPFLLDYATSMVADGKVSVARAKHEKIPTNWIRDHNGSQTDDPNAMLEGGWLMPFGEHKGYCLQLLMELMGGVMSGSRSGLDPESEPPSPNGIFAIAIDPEGFVGSDVFQERSSSILNTVRNGKPEQGRRILIPGDPEWETRKKRIEEGIPIPEETWQQIVKRSEELGVDPKYYANK